MNRWLDVTKLSFIIFSCVIFIIAFANLGENAYEAAFGENQKFKEGTMVGPVSLEGLTKQEATLHLADEFSEWNKNKQISIHFLGQQNTLQSDIFTVDLKGSVDLAIHGKQTPILIEVNESAYLDEINEIAGSVDLLNHNMVKNDLLKKAAMLSPEIIIDIESYVEGEIEDQFVVISQSKVSNIETVSLQISEWLQSIGTITLEPEQSFSLLNQINVELMPDTDDKLDALNIIATSIYKAILPTNFVIIERYTSKELPDFAEVGFESKIIPGKMDLSIYNPNKIQYQIRFELMSDTLYTEVKGLPLQSDYEIQTSELQTFDPKTILQYSPLQKEKVIVEEEGQEGYLINVYRHILDDKGNLIEKQHISEDFYPPVHRIEVHPLYNGATGKFENIDQDSNDGQNTADKKEEDDEDLIWGDPNESVKGIEK